MIDDSLLLHLSPFFSFFLLTFRSEGDVGGIEGSVRVVERGNA